MSFSLLLWLSLKHWRATQKPLQDVWKPYKEIAELLIDEEVIAFAERLITEGGIPEVAKADALHVSVAAVHNVDYLLTWNCRHIDNATRKPIIRAICVSAGYSYPEICTPMELLTEDNNDVL